MKREDRYQIEYSLHTRYKINDQVYQIVDMGTVYDFDRRKDVLHYDFKKLPDTTGKLWSIDTYKFSDLIHEGKIHVLLNTGKRGREVWT